MSFNSLSRDHKHRGLALSLHDRRGGFQLPLSGSHGRADQHRHLDRPRTFNSLSRDHTTIVNTSVFAGGSTFNSLSRDHCLQEITRGEKVMVLLPFNSLSRDHISRSSACLNVGYFQLPLSGSQNFRESGETEIRKFFQLPLSGSPLPHLLDQCVQLLELSTPSLGITLLFDAKVAELLARAFNSLSRDHRHLSRLAELPCGTRFQLPLSGSLWV